MLVLTPACKAVPLHRTKAVPPRRKRDPRTSVYEAAVLNNATTPGTLTNTLSYDEYKHLHEKLMEDMNPLSFKDTLVDILKRAKQKPIDDKMKEAIQASFLSYPEPIRISLNTLFQGTHREKIDLLNVIEYSQSFFTLASSLYGRGEKTDKKAKNARKELFHSMNEVPLYDFRGEILLMMVEHTDITARELIYRFVTNRERSQNEKNERYDEIHKHLKEFATVKREGKNKFILFRK